jgi:cytoskeletal protein CcmA (bactofilin family)
MLNNSTVNNVTVSGSLTSINSTINGDVTSSGSINLTQHSIVKGNIKSMSGQVNVDSSSSVSGNVIKSS